MYKRFRIRKNRKKEKKKSYREAADLTNFLLIIQAIDLVVWDLLYHLQVPHCQWTTLIPSLLTATVLIEPVKVSKVPHLEQEAVIMPEDSICKSVSKSGSFWIGLDNFNSPL